jgi:DNA-binding winged helix-turn-helix (wHTH) protein
MSTVSGRVQRAEVTTEADLSTREAPPTSYSFGRFTLDLIRGCFFCDAQEIKLRPKSFQLLAYLVENQGRLIGKDELMKAVWPDSFVTDDSIVQCVREIRHALQSDSHVYIKTVRI